MMQFDENKNILSQSGHYSVAVIIRAFRSKQQSSRRATHHLHSQADRDDTWLALLHYGADGIRIPNPILEPIGINVIAKPYSSSI